MPASAAGTLNRTLAGSISNRMMSGQLPKVSHVLLLSIDGMHGLDLQRFVIAHPTSNLALLSQRGTTYLNAYTSTPSDSFPGLLTMTTGGHPGTTGVYYEVNYDRSGFPPGSGCTGPRGTIVYFDESIDINSQQIDGGGGIDPTKLTQQIVNGTCQPVYPHNYLRVNDIFEAVKFHGLGRTAWSDKEQSYEMLSGPSGRGVDDFFNREIAAGGTTGSISATEAYDDTKVNAIINEIDGKSARGVKGVGVPTLFGMNFQAVSVGQKLANAEFGIGPRGGYLNAAGTPTPLLEGALQHTDASIGRFVAELNKQGLAQNTLIVISAKHGQAPIDITQRRAIANAATSFATQLKSNSVGFVQTDDLALIWLTNQSPANLANARIKLSDPAFETALGYEAGTLYTPSAPPPYWGPESDPRTPDFAVKVDLGVIYTGATKIAEHGGFSDEDSHVALLVARPTPGGAAIGGFAAYGRTIGAVVQTTQIAPTILEALGIDPNWLQAVRIEGTKTLPSLVY